MKSSFQSESKEKTTEARRLQDHSEMFTIPEDSALDAQLPFWPGSIGPPPSESRKSKGSRSSRSSKSSKSSEGRRKCGNNLEAADLDAWFLFEVVFHYSFQCILFWALPNKCLYFF